MGSTRLSLGAMHLFLITMNGLERAVIAEKGNALGLTCRATSKARAAA